MSKELEKEFVPYQESLELKKLGFDEPCLCFYNHNGQLIRYMNPDKDWNSLYLQTIKNSKITLPNTYSAPTYSKAFRFFREKGYDITFRKMDYGVESNFTGYYYTIYNGNEMIDIHGADKRTKTYEEAELACLRKLIEIVKQ